MGKTATKKETKTYKHEIHQDLEMTTRRFLKNGGKILKSFELNSISLILSCNFETKCFKLYCLKNPHSLNSETHNCYSNEKNNIPSMWRLASLKHGSTFKVCISLSKYNFFHNMYLWTRPGRGPL